MLITPPEVIAVTGAALVVVSGALGWAVRELNVTRICLRRADRFATNRDIEIDRLIDLNFSRRSVIRDLRISLAKHEAAEAKRQAQRVAASHAAAEKRRAHKGA